MEFVFVVFKSRFFLSVLEPFFWRFLHYNSSQQSDPTYMTRAGFAHIEMLRFVALHNFSRANLLLEVSYLKYSH
jgi:hypothetical protein